VLTGTPNSARRVRQQKLEPTKPSKNKFAKQKEFKRTKAKPPNLATKPLKNSKDPKATHL
jgi:hypothetical protein